MADIGEPPIFADLGDICKLHSRIEGPADAILRRFKVHVGAEY